MAIAFSSHASRDSNAYMQLDYQHISSWNEFFKRVYALHLYQLSKHDVYTKTSHGGYWGKTDFYREVKYYNSENDQLLAKIQWEIAKPDQIHVIEVYVYNQHNQLQRDYLVAFLPEHRNAPIQTLVNLHYHDREFHSYRQFDASGARIYEECKGRYFNEPLFISLMEDDFYTQDKFTLATLNGDAYLACFEHLPIRAQHYLNPLHGLHVTTAIIEKAGINYVANNLTEEDIEQQITLLSQQIVSSKNPAHLYLQRGKAYFTAHEFNKASADYTAALKLDDKLDEAYFGRGMALGRAGEVKEGIQDLTQYIKRNPDSSLAYTKRGVRNIWAGNLEHAEQDLKQAIRLNPSNAEAHDDLGVLYAQKKNYDQSLHHFQQVVKLDPSYQKGFHNLAMTLHITGQNQQALNTINKALNLANQDKNSLLLKAQILMAMGMKEQANKIIQRAEFLPDGNWSERFPVQ
jgi:tetratricopeptide (TPR) repeat protein